MNRASKSSRSVTERGTDMVNAENMGTVDKEGIDDDKIELLEKEIYIWPV